MRPLSAIAVAVLSLGLAAFRYPTTVEAPAVVVAPSFTITDGLPADQAKSEFESLMITNCAYGSIRVGARDISPAPLEVVRDGLAARANAALASKQVVLSNFTVHVNGALAQRAQVGAANPSIIAGVMNKQYVKDPNDRVGCAPDDLQGGYTLDEVEGAPLVTVIDVMVDGREHHARCIVASPMAYPPMERVARKKPELVAQWNATVTAQVGCALDKLAGQINSGKPVAFTHAEEARKLARREEERRCAAARQAGKVCRKQAAGEAAVAAPAPAPVEAPAATEPAAAPVPAAEEKDPAEIDGTPADDDQAG
jgi:hypothetical protein